MNVIVKSEFRSGTRRMLKRLPHDIQRRIVRKALRFAVRPILRAAKAGAPRQTGKLKKSIKARQRTRAGVVTISITSSAPLFSIMELGTTIRRTKAGANRGRVAPRLMLRRAVTAHASGVPAVLEDRIAQEVRKHWEKR